MCISSLTSAATSRPDACPKGAGTRVSTNSSSASRDIVRRRLLRPGHMGTAGWRKPLTHNSTAHTNHPNHQKNPSGTSTTIARRETHLCAPGLKRKNDVSTVQLPAGKQVERSGEHSHPSRNRNRVQQHVSKAGQRMAGADAGNIASELKDERKSELDILVKRQPE